MCKGPFGNFACNITQSGRINSLVHLKLPETLCLSHLPETLWLSHEFRKNKSLLNKFAQIGLIFEVKFVQLSQV